MKRLPLVADFLLFILLSVSLAYWGMQLFKPPVRPVAAPPQTGPVAPRIEAAAGLFGGRPAGAAVASNFQLKGVIAAGPEGVAILSADGKPPQAVGVGMEAAPGVKLKEVHRQYVMLDEGGTLKRVDLPESAKGGMDFGGAPPVSAGPAPSMPAPVMNVNNGPPPGQQSPANPQPVPMQPMTPPAASQQPGSNEAPQSAPAEAPPPKQMPGSHPGLVR